MRGQAQPGLARAVETPGEIPRLPGVLIPRDAEAGDETAGRLCRAQRRAPGDLRAQVAHSGDDAAKGDAQVGLSLLRGLGDGRAMLAPGGQIAAPAEIRRQEKLGIDHPVRGALFGQGQGQAAKIFRLLQGQAGGRIDAQEIGEPVKAIAAPVIEDAGDVDAPRAGQITDEGRRGGALQMQVQFDLWQGRVDTVWHGRFPG